MRLVAKAARCFFLTLIIFSLSSCLTKVDKDNFIISNQLLTFEDDQNIYFSLRVPTLKNETASSDKRWAMQIANYIVHKSGYFYQFQSKAIATNYIFNIAEIALNKRKAEIFSQDKFFVKEVSPYGENEQNSGLIYFCGIEKKFYESLIEDIKPANYNRSIACQFNLWDRILTHWQLANICAEYNIEKNNAKFLVYIENLKSDIEQINLQRESFPSTIYLFESNGVPFISVFERGQNFSVANIPIDVTWKDSSIEKNKNIATRRLKSDIDGSVRFFLPTILSRESGIVNFSVATNELVISRLIKEKEKIDALEEIITLTKAKKIQFMPKVLSNAKYKKIAVSIMQFDRGGTLLSKELLSSSICASELNSEGFNATTLENDSFGTQLNSKMTPRELFAGLSGSVKKSSGWFVVASVSLGSFSEVSGIWEGSASGELNLIDSNGTVLFKTNISASGRGNNAETVLNLIWRSIGKNAKKELATAVL